MEKNFSKTKHKKKNCEPNISKIFLFLFFEKEGAKINKTDGECIVQGEGEEQKAKKMEWTFVFFLLIYVFFANLCLRMFLEILKILFRRRFVVQKLEFSFKF